MSDEIYKDADFCIQVNPNCQENSPFACAFLLRDGVCVGGVQGGGHGFRVSIDCFPAPETGENYEVISKNIETFEQAKAKLWEVRHQVPKQ